MFAGFILFGMLVMQGGLTTPIGLSVVDAEYQGVIGLGDHYESSLQGSPRTSFVTAYSQIVRGDGVDLHVMQPDNKRGSVEILDVSGRLVEHFNLDATQRNVHWDGRVKGGTLAPTGIYFVRAGESYPALRLLVLR